MRKIKMIFIKRKYLYLIFLLLVGLPTIIFLFIYLPAEPANVFLDPKNGIIVIDPGHGGVDGGTTKEGIFEKDINLDISQKLKLLLVQKGYTVILTREKDISLEKLDNSQRSRHLRDLNARANIINRRTHNYF
jgi:N-acetylmuramoyl-L-alanine amidase